MPVDFNSLYDLYNSNNLVMIIGSEILHIENQNGLTFEQKAIQKITDKSYQECPKTFSDLAIKFPNINLSSNKLIGIYNSFHDPNIFDTNLIQLIADLPKVNLFIQTSFDTKLKEQLGNNVETIVWNHKVKEPFHLNLTNGKKKVFYLFGDTSEGISIFEEEQIDCLLNLSIYNEINKSRTSDRYSFLEYLKDKTLVFIGNNFTDWFMRLMIRTLYNSPITSQPDKAYIVNDNSIGLTFERYFFDKFKIELIHESPIEDFLNKLHNTIRAKQTFDNWYEPKKVFISYDRTDSQYANELKECLNRKHIDAFLDTYDMGIAEHERKIISLIRAEETCIFVCVISKIIALKEEEGSNKSYAKRIEWKTAKGRFDANNYLSNGGENSLPPFFIIPTSIDDFQEYKHLLPEFITKNNILPFKLKQLCDLIEEEIKNINYEYKKPI